MQTDKLSWRQAKNLLVTGMAKRVRYMPGQGALNSFGCNSDGLIVKLLEDLRGNLKGTSQICEPDYRNKLFYVVEGVCIPIT